MLAFLFFKTNFSASLNFFFIPLIFLEPSVIRNLTVSQNSTNPENRLEVNWLKPLTVWNKVEVRLSFHQWFEIYLKKSIRI